VPCRQPFVVVVASLATIAVFAVHASAASVPIEVTACGQEVPHGASAYLSADLTCPFETNAVAVRLGGGAKLDLQGHTLTGGIAAVACGDVLCVGDWCGPTRKSGACQIANGTITGAHYEAVSAGKAVLRNVTLVDNRAYGVLAFHRAEIYDSHVADTPNGAQANILIRIKNSTFDAAPVQAAKKIELDASSVTNCNNSGVAGVRVRLKNGSTVVGNAANPQCGQPDFNCADILSERAPWLDGTSSCGTSLDSRTLAAGSTPVSWGVCTND
jgi:hypothetical protein